MTPAESHLRGAVENGYPHHTLTIKDGRELLAEIDRLTRERNKALGEIESFVIENDTLRHQVIACGVAASHPDANLSRTGAYAGKWNSAQAESVRKLRAGARCAAGRA